MDRRKFLQLSMGAGGVLALSAIASATGVGTNIRRLAAGFDPALINVTAHFDLDDVQQCIRLNMLIEGMERSDGIRCAYGRYNTPSEADMAIITLWRQEKVIDDADARGMPLLIVEQGFFSPRDKWVTLAWDGYNGLGRFAPAPQDDNGKRWEKHFAHLLKPWQKKTEGYALLFGQRPDLYLKKHAIDPNGWAQQVTDELVERGHQVMYKPHPHVRLHSGRNLFVPNGAVLSPSEMNKSLEQAAFCVTLCTNAAVETVLAGYSTIALDRASMAWPVTSHSLDEPYYYPDRLPWCHDMAWRHWRFAELKDGRAWQYVKRFMHG